MATVSDSYAVAARTRAHQGIAPRSAQDARRYLTVDDVYGPGGKPLPEPLRRILLTAWRAGFFRGWEYWLADLLYEGLPYPLGDIQGTCRHGHAWAWIAPGWATCSRCYVAAFCPGCAPDWEHDWVLERLPQRVCPAHQGRVRACL